MCIHLYNLKLFSLNKKCIPYFLLRQLFNFLFLGFRFFPSIQRTLIFGKPSFFLQVTLFTVWAFPRNLGMLQVYSQEVMLLKILKCVLAADPFPNDEPRFSSFLTQRIGKDSVSQYLCAHTCYTNIENNNFFPIYCVCCLLHMYVQFEIVSSSVFTVFFNWTPDVLQGLLFFGLYFLQ